MVLPKRDIALSLKLKIKVVVTEFKCGGKMTRKILFSTDKNLRFCLNFTGIFF